MRNLLRGLPGWDQVLITSSYLYLVIPILIFFFGWLKLPLALFAAVLLVTGTWFALRDFGYIRDYRFVSFEFLFFSFLIVAVWVGLSGIGGFGRQSWDFLGRNAIFRDLINHPWPVLYDYTEQPAMRELFGSSQGGLVYYFAYWLPSAIVGKFLGWKAANIALYCWTVAGVFLCILLMARFTRRASILLVLAFVLFGGMDFLGLLITEFNSFLSDATINGSVSTRELIGDIFFRMLASEDLDGRSYVLSQLEYHSFTAQLFWPFNQAVPAWLATLLIVNLSKKENLFYTYSLLLFFSPLPAIGLVLFVLYKIIRPDWTTPNQPAVQFRNWKHWLKGCLSYQNTIVVALIAFLAIAFYSAQIGIHKHGFIWDFLPINLDSISRFALFLLLECYLFGFLALNKKDNRILIVISLVTLSLIPLYIYGRYNDFGMKVSNPALVILFTIGIKNIADGFEIQPAGFRSLVYKILVVLVLLVGSITPLHEIMRSRDAIVKADGFPPYSDSWITFDEPGKLEKMDDAHDFIISNPRETWFFKFLAPRE